MSPEVSALRVLDVIVWRRPGHLLMHSRAVAERLGVPLDEIAWRIAARQHLDLPDDGGPR